MGVFVLLVVVVTLGVLLVTVPLGIVLVLRPRPIWKVLGAMVLGFDLFAIWTAWSMVAEILNAVT